MGHRIFPIDRRITSEGLKTLIVFTIFGYFLIHSTVAAAVSSGEGRGRRPVDYGLQVETLGYALGKSAVALCERQNVLTGLLIQEVGRFRPADRETAQEGYAFTSGFGVFDIVPESPAAKAGVQNRDEIIALNGGSVLGFRVDLIHKDKASYDRTDAFEDYLDGLLMQGPVEVTVRRRGDVKSFTLHGEEGCGGRFVYRTSEKLNAWSDGKYVAVTSTMIRAAESDDELAFVIAHEMAHNILHHNDKRGRPAKGKERSAAAGPRQKEMEADRLALTIMSASGFDVAAASSFLQRAKPDAPQFLSFSHPGVQVRMAAIELQAKQVLRASKSQSAPTFLK